MRASPSFFFSISQKSIGRLVKGSLPNKAILTWYSNKHQDLVMHGARIVGTRLRFSHQTGLSGSQGQSIRVILLGHLRGGTEKSVYFAPDLRESLAKTDKFEVDVCNLIDRFIERAGLDAPEEVIPQLRDGYMADEVTELDLQHADISTIIWAMGYTFDFSMVKMSVFDRDGFPIQARGVSHYPGLYFVGMPWLHTQKSGLLVGVGEDAKWIASDIMGA